MYEERASAQGIVHLHCTHCVAVSCLRHADDANVLPPLTAYYVMRVGRLPLVPYYRPGDRALAEAVREKARKHHALLLANHGPVVAGKSLEDAVYNAEEMEETAKLHLLLTGRDTRALDAAQIADLEAAFPS
jgi:ribulose-5-phosphate 4-epimerase/fuculose-1-phosphate aldolase